MTKQSHRFIGLMSGTSLDGVDAVLAQFQRVDSGEPARMLAACYLPFPQSVKDGLMVLQASSMDEIHHEALASNTLAGVYAEAVRQLLSETGFSAHDVRAIGAHGQTIRHRPELGYTRQIGNPALLAELTGIDVVADFRSRDIAAGGQGAPLVPAFHNAMFAKQGELRVVANIGGFANISVLHPDGSVAGFDTGPGNVLLDCWCVRHCDRPYDAGGAWAAAGNVVPGLLTALLDEPFFSLAPPKSTGRDLFHSAWLDAKLAPFSHIAPVDVQATLTAFTAATIADAIADHAGSASGVYVCGGGAYNDHLMDSLRQALAHRLREIHVESTQALGVPPNQVEAFAFAWLAHRHIERQPGNLASVTGSRGARVLGALYPA